MIHIQQWGNMVLSSCSVEIHFKNTWGAYNPLEQFTRKIEEPASHASSEFLDLYLADWKLKGIGWTFKIWG